MFDRIADWIITRARRTPYWHLPGLTMKYYMERYWLIPYFDPQNSDEQPGCYQAKWYRNPLVWLCQQFDIAARVHIIRESDPQAKGHHDHPWAYISVILKGGYIEVTPKFRDGIYVGDTRTWHGPGSILFRRAKNWHSVELPLTHEFTPPGWPDQWREAPCTTLFITFKYQQKWGFLRTPAYKQYYRDAFAEAASKLPELK